MDDEKIKAEDIDAIVFDVIGTLVDEDGTWAAVSERLAEAAGIEAAGPGATGSGAAQELHSRWAGLLNASMDDVVAGRSPWRSHQLLVAETASQAIEELGGEASAATEALVATLDRQYPAWPDVTEATTALRRGRLVIGASNGDLDALAVLANVNAIAWDTVVSLGTAETFKPAPAAYRYVIEALALTPARTLFVAAHPWDLRAASEHGFRTAYVARPGAERPSPDDRFDLGVTDLTELVRILT